MIQIDKPAAGPEILTREGPRLTAEHEADYAAGRAVEFDRTVYAAREVTRALYAAQYGKCCYCEQTRGPSRELDVEHFRPKAESQQGIQHPSERPGYYWLAYAWGNLYLACKPCNQEFKRSLFPLVDPSARMRSPGDEDVEAPLFIDPGVDDPEQFIGFDGPEVCPRGDSLRGVTTIRLLELSRRALNRQRRGHFEVHRLCLGVVDRIRGREVELPLHEREEIAGIIAKSVAADAPFAGMMRACLRRHWGDDLRLPVSVPEVLAYMDGELLPRGPR